MSDDWAAPLHSAIFDLWPAQHSQTRLLAPHDEPVPFSALSAPRNLEHNRISDTATDSSDRVPSKGSQRTFLTRKQCRKALVTLGSQVCPKNLFATHCLPSPRHICCAQSVQFCIPPMCKLLQRAGAAYKLVRAATCIAGVGRALTCIDLVNTPTRYAALRPTITAALFSDARPAAEKSLD